MALAPRLTGDQRIRLRDIDPKGEQGIDRDAATARAHALTRQLGRLQEICYAAATESVLIILQGMDTSGKDGAVRHVFDHVNPQGVIVTSFKVPTPQERAHDFLWRVHQATPARGMFAIFNRSQYEGVLVERVKQLVPEAVWRGRYAQINAFEQLLASEGTIILKFFLYISKDEQEERLLAREQDPEKAWKLSAGDWVERRAWDDYLAAYEDAVNACATPAAPWYVVPANRKWYRDIAMAEAIVETLAPREAGWREALAKQGAIAEAEVLAARSPARQ